MLLKIYLTVASVDKSSRMAGELAGELACDCLTKRSARYARVDEPHIKHPTVTRSLVGLDHDLYQEEQM